MASLYWSTDMIVDSILKWKKAHKKWPKSRDMWWSNSHLWPSFTTVIRNVGSWEKAIELAKEKESGTNII